ncbi:MAG TPA: glycosyltransferase family 2 protein [Candidatus Acidoferrales bacterium]|nr:glycosyltransferase family 2 protein [Candidatus Acidoferrales bacterium]
MSETVSIIIPTRNRSAILARCLAALPDGVRGLDPPEVIVVDDCSSDATPQAVQEFARSSGWRVVCHSHRRPLGANSARNQALKIARGEIIVFIDDDVIVTDGWLPKLLSGLSTEVSVVAGAVRVTMEGPLVGRHREEVSSFFAEVLTPPLGLEGEVVPILGNMAAFRWVFDRASFGEILRPPIEEIDWLRRAGVSARFVPEALVWHYKTPEEMRLKRVLRMAWFRGSEGGWWIRECVRTPSRELLPMAARSLNTSVRAFGHAILKGCWGGAVVGVGELSRALALAGLINRGARVPESWR